MLYTTSSLCIRSNVFYFVSMNPTRVFVIIRSLIITILLGTSYCSSAQLGYDTYHQQINNAERCMFLQNNYDSARYYYDKTFKEFDFCFLKDCIIAAELAAFYKDDSSCIRYILKGFDNGLKLTQLLDIRGVFWSSWRVTVFDTFIARYEVAKYLGSEYPGRRYKYIHRIDSTMRRLVNEIYMFDQIAKLCTDMGGGCNHKYDYPENKLTPLFDSLIRTVGYPGERIAGIDDVGLATELNMPEEEPRAIFKRLKRSDSTLKNVQEGLTHIFFMDFTCYSTRIPFIYNSCAYNIFKPYFLDQVKKGNIHPREVAAIFQRSGYYMTNPKCHITDKASYRISSYNSDIKPADIVKSNEKRAAMYICSNELDFAKADFQQKHRILLFFGAFMLEPY